MGPDDALRAVSFIQPGTVIPCHCNTFDQIIQDRQAFKQRVDSETDATAVILDPGQSYTAQ